MTLMDLLVEHKPPNADEAASSREVSHECMLPIGLSGLQPLEVQSRTLHTILESIGSKKEFLQLGLHVVPICASQLVAYARVCMESYTQKKLPVRHLPDLRPYFRMFGTILAVVANGFHPCRDFSMLLCPVAVLLMLADICHLTIHCIMSLYSTASLGTKQIAAASVHLNNRSPGCM